jgi:hypothetical protein
MAKLSKVNKYAILWLKSQGLSDEIIKKELGVTIKQIESIEAPQQNTQTESNDRKTSKDFMIHETANRVNSVAIMTKEASSMNDDFKKTNKPNNTSRNQNNIHKIS